jgi:proteasome lid subunit RPN8/RPN11
VNHKYFPPVERWFLPESAFRDSLAEMALDGVLGNEGVVFWLGRRSNGEARITHVIALRGPGAIKRPAQLVIHESVFASVTDIAIDHGVSMIGQIHSHGPGYSTDLSPTDRMYGIAVPHYLSLVAPDYALRSNISLAECGIHVLEPGYGFTRMSAEEIRSRVVLTSNSRSQFLIAGDDQYA